MKLTNADRGERTAQLLDRYSELVNGDRDDEETLLTDVLADLMHWADCIGADWGTALDRAEMHHEAERTEQAAVEVKIHAGLPSFTSAAASSYETRNTRDRVRAAILSSGYTWPMRRITVRVNYRPDLAVWDLPIALALLAASGQITPAEIDDEYRGELGLNGAIRSGSHKGKTLRQMIETTRDEPGAHYGGPDDESEPDYGGATDGMGHVFSDADPGL